MKPQAKHLFAHLFLAHHHAHEKLEHISMKNIEQKHTLRLLQEEVQIISQLLNSPEISQSRAKALQEKVKVIEKKIKEKQRSIART